MICRELRPRLSLQYRLNPNIRKLRNAALISQRGDAPMKFFEFIQVEPTT